MQDECMSIVESAKYVSQFNFQRLCQNLDVPETDVGLAALDCPNVCTVKTRDVGKFILTPFVLLSKVPDSVAETFLNSLHAEQCPRRLCKHIPCPSRLRL